MLTHGPFTVLLVGCSQPAEEAIRQRLAGAARVFGARDEEDVLRQAGETPPDLLCTGEELAGETAASLVRRVHERFPGAGTRYLVFAAGANLEPFEALLQGRRLRYLGRRTPRPAEQAELVAGALDTVPPVELGTDADRDRKRAFTESLARLALQSEPASMAELLADAVRTAVAADRADVLLHDRDADVLWQRDPDSGGERVESAAVGIASYVLRSGQPAVADRAGDDPRYDAESDTPEGSGRERLAAVPLGDGEGPAHGVIVVRRRAHGPPFNASDRRRLKRLALQAAPYFDRWQSEEAAWAEAARGVEKRLGEAVFRRQALTEHLRGADRQGDVLRLGSRWLSWCYRGLVVALLLLTAVLAAGYWLNLGAGFR